jgi:hypothetical protein
MWAPANEERVCLMPLSENHAVDDDAEQPSHVKSETCHA